MAKKRGRKKPHAGRKKPERGKVERELHVEVSASETTTAEVDDEAPEPEEEVDAAPGSAPPDEVPDEEIRKPHPAAAAFLSLVVPGAGQVYAGRRTRGVMWWAIPSAVVLTCAALARVLGPWPLLIALLGAGVIPRILAPADAYLMAKRPDAAAPAGLIVILGLMGLFAGNRGVANLIDRFFFSSYGVLTHTMTPSLLPGDQVFVDRRAYGGTPAGPGDAVLVGDEEQARILRVVAQKGDTVAWRDGHLVINGEPVRRCPAGALRIREEEHPVHVVWLDDKPFLMVDDGQTIEARTVESDLALLGDGLVVAAVEGASLPDLPRFEERSTAEVRGRPWTIFWSTPPPGDDNPRRMDRVGKRLDGDRPFTTSLPEDLVRGIEGCLQP